MKKSLYHLASSVMAVGTPAMLTPDLRAVLETGDTQGYLVAFLHDELKAICSNPRLTGLPETLYVRTARIEIGANPVLHVRVERFPDNVSAKRSIPLAPLGVPSFWSVREHLTDSMNRLQEALVAAAQWPEFAPPQVVAEPNPPASAVLKALPTPEADSELLARLQRHMHDFISMYSPATQEVLAANWEQFRPQVTPA